MGDVRYNPADDAIEGLELLTLPLPPPPPPVGVGKGSSGALKVEENRDDAVLIRFPDDVGDDDEAPDARDTEAKVVLVEFVVAIGRGSWRWLGI